MSCTFHNRLVCELKGKMQNQVHLAVETVASDRSEARNLFETSMKSKFSYFMFLRGASSVQRPQIMHGLIFALELAVGGSIGGFLASLYSISGLQILFVVEPA